MTKHLPLTSLSLFLTMFLAGRIFSAESVPETLASISARAAKESSEAYAASPFSTLSKNYFARFSRDPEAKVGADEMIFGDWEVAVAPDADPLVLRIAQDFVDFAHEAMGSKLGIVRDSDVNPRPQGKGRFIFTAAEDGSADDPEGFQINVGRELVRVRSKTPAGLRDGVVMLAGMIGMREAPILPLGEKYYAPRLKVRLGTIPLNGSPRDLVFMGYNAVFAGGGNLHTLSTSDAIPELAARRQRGLMEANIKSAAAARDYGLKTFAFLDTRQKFKKNDPVFAAHPDIRGALTWSADGEYVLCTEHPLVKQYLAESMEGLFRADPRLDGVVIIIGGEGFYHCFMRPYGVEKGHTNCARCEKLGAETVVANLCNLLAESARKVNPKAEIVIWPYSAEHVWSADKDQAGLIRKLNPGVALLTEIEKDEYVEKEGGVRKHLWDYSIDLIGPGERAKRQIAECAARGIPVYLKSEPELAFEAPRLPHIPCMDRWADRAEALASCGATGAWGFPAFRPCYGTSAAELAKNFWWNPAPAKDEFLEKFVERIAGREAGPRLREAWRRVSESIAYSPEIPPYYTGPYYLGPAQPMCADSKAEVPQVFYGYYLFMAEMNDAEGMKKRPTFLTGTRGDAPVFLKLYRKMESALKIAADEMNAARPLVDERHKLMFDAEDSPVQWFYRTARTEANFYESCILRDSLIALAEKEKRSDEDLARAKKDFARWLNVLRDERENTAAALPVMEHDVRLDFRYGGDHTFEHGAEMLRAKLTLIEGEIKNFVPSLAQRIGIALSESDTR